MLHVAEQAGGEQNPAERRPTVTNGRRRCSIDRREVDPHDAVLHDAAGGRGEEDLAGIPVAVMAFGDHPEIQPAVVMPLHRHRHVAAMVEQFAFVRRQIPASRDRQAAEAVEVGTEETHQIERPADGLSTARLLRHATHRAPAPALGTARSSRNSRTSRRFRRRQEPIASSARCRWVPAIRVAFSITPARS